MSFFSIDVYPSFIYGSVIAYVLNGICSRYKQNRQNEIDLQKKYHEQYYNIYYRVAQLEEKVEMLEGKQADMLIHS